MKVFGLIGSSLKNSYSKDYFQMKFAQLSLPYLYENFEITEIKDIRKLILDQPELCGFNVTRPYKESIISYLDQLDESADKVGAVNCVAIQKENGNTMLKGYNTDVYGFEMSLLSFIEPLASENRRAIVFGSGGAAKAICFVLKKLLIPFTQVVRTVVDPGTVLYKDVSEDLIGSNYILINCTPVGMFPNEEEILPVPYHAINKKHYCYDLIYLPVETRFLKAAVKHNAHTKNGLEMLHLQAERTLEIWLKE